MKVPDIKGAGKLAYWIRAISSDIWIQWQQLYYLYGLGCVRAANRPAKRYVKVTIQK